MIGAGPKRIGVGPVASKQTGDRSITRSKLGMDKLDAGISA